LTLFRAVLKARTAKLAESEKMLPGFEGLSPWSYAWMGAVRLGAGFVHGLIGLGFPTLGLGFPTLAALAAGVRIRGGIDPQVTMRRLRRFLWAMAVLLVFQFFRSLLAPE
jgi:hypothetical protein